MITPSGDHSQTPRMKHPRAPRRRAWGLLVVAMLALALPVDAGAQGPSTAAPAAPPAPGDVDTERSRVYIFVGKTGFGHDHAIVGRLASGRVVLDAAENAGQLVFDMPSFRADTPDARKALGLSGETDASTRQQTTDNMLGAEVLDVTRHPTATFDIESALRSRRRAEGAKPTVDLVGTFTLHGVARKVVIPVEIESAGPILRFLGSFRIKQTDFGMKPYKKLGGVVGVTDELVIHGDIRVAATPVAGPAANLTTPTAQPPAGRLPAEQPVPAAIGGPR
ncbi:MAG: YceI family protein [Planctomycetia bacterium]